MKALHTMMAAAMAAAMLACPVVWAHASLKASDPQAGATVAPPREITLTFNEKIEQAFSSATVADSQGKAVSTDKATVDGANPTVLRLAVPALPAGTYTVSWAVAGHDGHRRKGEFKFSVK
jgi:copper resistance protein C